jgi:hypothetical protein
MIKDGVHGHHAPTFSGGDFFPPVDNAFDLGSAAFSWRTVYFDTAVIGGVVTGDWSPSVAATYNLGSALLEWLKLFLGDDGGLFMGNDQDTVIYHKAGTLGANTALTGVLIGTPVSQALAANSTLISNVTASGDIAMYGNLAGNSQQFLFYDTSASALWLLMAKLQYYAQNFVFQEATNIAFKGTLGFQTRNAAAALTSRLNISDSLDIAVATWSAITHTGIVSAVITNNDGYLGKSNVDNSYVRITGGSSAASGYGGTVVVGGKTAAIPGAILLYTPNATSDGDVERLRITGVVATAVASWTAVQMTLVTTQTIADDVAHTGFDITMNGSKTSAAYTSAMYGIAITANIAAANTQNWNNSVAGLRGVDVLVSTTAGSTGTLSWAVGLKSKATIVDAMTVTNWAGLLVSTPAITNSKLTNAYGIYIEAISGAATLNYAIYSAGGAVSFNGSNVYIGDTSNVNMTVGLTINQGASDDEVLAFKSSDVAHGVTTLAETDTYASFSKYDAAGGGLKLLSLSDANQTAATPTLSLQAISGIALDTTKSTAGRGAVEVYAAIASGTGIGTITADGNIFAVRHYTGAAYVADMIVDEDGDLWLNGGITTGGVASLGYIQNYFMGNLTSDGGSNYADKTHFGGILTGVSGDTSGLTHVVILPTGTVTQTAADVIAHVESLYVAEPVITLGGGSSITIASTLYIASAPTEGVANYALYVAAGAVKFCGTTIGFFNSTPVAQQTGIAAQKVNYTTPDLDTEAEIISAFNTTNAAINVLRTALNNLGLTTTV